MNPEIVERGRIILVGFSLFGDPFAESGGWTEENEIGRLWNRFTAYFIEHGDRIHHVKDAAVAYEVHVESAETATKGHIAYLSPFPVINMTRNDRYSGYTLPSAEHLCGDMRSEPSRKLHVEVLDQVASELCHSPR